MVEVQESARNWLGTKFCHQGRIKGVGVDCIGLITGVANDLGIKFEDQTNYPREPNGLQLQHELEKYLKDADLHVGAVALFKIEKAPQHVGIITEYGSGFGLIHAYAQARKVVEHNLDDSWRKRIVKTYAFS